MTRLVRWGLVIVAAVVLVAIAALAAVPYLVDTPRIQALIARQATQALGRPVKFSSLSVRVLPLPAVVLKRLEVAEDPAFGRGAFLRLDEARVRLRLWPLLFLRVELGDFVLERPVISLVQAADGRWNFASLGGPVQEAPGPARRRGAGAGAGAAVLGTRVAIDDGVVTYESRARGGAGRYRVEGLDLTLTPASGSVAFEGGFVVEPGDLRVKISDGAVTPIGIRALTDAGVRARVSLDGKSLGALAAASLGPEPAVAGGVKGTLVIAGTVGKPKAAGDVELRDFAVTQTTPRCPEPRRRTLTLGTVRLTVAWEDSRFAARPVTTRLGDGTISSNVTATLDRGRRVELADLRITGVPVEKVLVDYLCQSYAVTGPLELTGAASTRLGALWTTLDGKGQVRLGPGKVVGSQALAVIGNVVRVGGTVSSLLGGELPASFATSPMDYESMTATYTITDGVVSTRDFRFTSRAMNVAAAGTYALASGVVNLDVVVTHGRGEIRGKVTGPASSPSIRVHSSSGIRGGEAGKVEKGLRDLLKRFR